MESIQVLLISGSIRQPSYTCILTERVEKALLDHGATTTHWNLRKMPLPIADPAFHHDPSRHTDKTVSQFIALANSADAFILASPIYHNSYSGVLKNALDNLAIPQFYHKPVGLMSHGANRSTQAVDHLRIVVRGLIGVATPTHVCTDKQDYREKGMEDYELVSEEILQRIERFAVELTMFASLFRLIR